MFSCPCRSPRPHYLEDLVDVDFAQADTVGLFVRETIGGEIYAGPDNFLLNMTVDEVQQWNLEGSQQHPFHMHVNHMQFVSVDGPVLVPGWNQVGDWVDTVSSECAYNSATTCTSELPKTFWMGTIFDFFVIFAICDLVLFRIIYVLYCL